VAPPGANGTTNLIGALNSCALGDETLVSELNASMARAIVFFILDPR
jgi:hypothetical protein